MLDLELALDLPDAPPETLVVVEESPLYPGELVFQPLVDEQQFYHRYNNYLSRYLVLNELSNLGAFWDQLAIDGYHLVFGSSAAPILESVRRWGNSLKVPGYTLHPFQSFGLNRALERDFHFFNWCPGAGKSFCSAIGARILFDQKKIEQVLAFTLSAPKTEFCRFFQGAGLDAVVNDGTKDKRRRVYREGHEVYVLNYEKSWHDEAELTELTKGRRVLFILDEVAKIITDTSPNKARKAIDKMVKGSQARIWPMSATVVNGNPLRYRDVFSLDGHPRTNPLGTKAEFVSRYAHSVSTYQATTRNGGSYQVVDYDWNLNRLQEIRHRVGWRTQAVRKTDPAVAAAFKGLQTIVVPVEMSDSDRVLVEEIVQEARLAKDRGETLMPFYRLLRYTCNTPRALLHTEDEIGRQIAAAHPLRCHQKQCAKLETLNELLDQIREAGDKVVVFTRWTNLTLHLIAPEIKVPYVVHYGVGQSNKDSQAAIDRFMTDPTITALLSSDAGSHGLNLQQARYVIQYEPTYSYDEGMQRAGRIDRADSHLDGLTNYVLLTSNSVEERVWDIQQQRRAITSAVQGTVEMLSYGNEPGKDELDYLIFGRQKDENE